MPFARKQVGSQIDTWVWSLILLEIITYTTASMSGAILFSPSNYVSAQVSNCTNNCEWKSWSIWSSCSSECKQGSRDRTRGKDVNENLSDSVCCGSSVTEVICNTISCGNPGEGIHFINSCNEIKYYRNMKHIIRINK